MFHQRKVHTVLRIPESFPQGSDPPGLTGSLAPRSLGTQTQSVSNGMPWDLARPIWGSKQPCQEPVSTGALPRPTDERCEHWVLPSGRVLTSGPAQVIQF